MYFDSHAHYDDEQFDTDRDELLFSMRENNVGYIVNAAQDLRTAYISKELAEKYDFIWFAAGFHPHEAKYATDDALSEIKALLSHPRNVAVGEIGLDYHYDYSPRDVQKDVFAKHLAIAEEVKLPAVVHDREATGDCMDIIRGFPDVHGVVHCFSGSWETAKELLDRGWYLSFTGAVTFKNARKAVEVVSKMPLDRLMIETDSPYMTPEPKRGSRNSSLNLPFIAKRIAEIRSLSVEEIEALTTENARRFFSL